MAKGPIRHVEKSLTMREAGKLSEGLTGAHVLDGDRHIPLYSRLNCDRGWWERSRDLRRVAAAVGDRREPGHQKGRGKRIRQEQGKGLPAPAATARCSNKISCSIG
jgi:hypothetical protein